MKAPVIVKNKHRLTALAWAALTCATLGYAPLVHAQLNLLKEPSNARVTEPAPNIILSLDDSGSMGWDLNGCMSKEFRVDVYGSNFNEGGRAGCPWYASNPNESRMQILRSALLDTFGNPATGDKGSIEDNRIRLSWQSMWDNGRTRRPGVLQNSQDTLSTGQANNLKPFSGVHRQNFAAFIGSLTPVYGTPSHKMMRNVRNYMRTTEPFNSPDSSAPLACRRTYHILMTDGAWNSGTSDPQDPGNADGTGVWPGNTTGRLPDGTLYPTTSAQTRVYRDSHGGSTGTLADWAFANWATDFQTGIKNEIKPIIKVPGTEAVGATNLEEYWNPKNNPMTWQGVTQYTIGFGRSATNWSVNPLWGGDTHGGQGYMGLVNNNSTWSDVYSGGEAARPLDLWHMAINGRGKYYQATVARDLRNAFEDILQTILVDTSSSLAAGTGSNLKLGQSGLAFLSAYDGKRWKGELAGVQVTSQGTTGNTIWSAEKLLDNRNLGSSPRRILTHNGSAPTTFQWTDLSTAQQNALKGTDPDSVGQARLNYLVGDRSLEQPKPNGTFRQRDSRLGSLVNSVPVYMPPPTLSAINYSGRRAFITSYAQRRPVLFVGSNGGMLHAFDASNTGGNELFAYVPRGVYSKLRDYTSAGYQHQFMVDGSPMVGDAQINSEWRSVLVGTLGLGGRGFFVLNVTDPNSFASATPSSMVLFDRTEPTSTGTDQHIGHIASQPAVDDLDDTRSAQIVKLNNGQWAAVLGNGVNSASGQAVLLIQQLDAGQNNSLLHIPTNGSTNNGLGTPRLMDLDGNGTADIAYSGDLQGNLWSFDLTSTNAAEWSARFNKRPLFVARTAGNAVQPITAAPYVMRVPRSQSLQVAFGSGRLMDTADATNTTTQSLYSVRDNFTYVRNTSGVLTLTETTHIDNGRASLVAQTSNAFSGNFASTSSNPVDYASKRGWFLDLNQSGERHLANADVFQDSIVRFKTMIPSTQPSGESCNLTSVQGRFFSTYLDIFSGMPANKSVFGLSSTSFSRVQQGSAVELTLTKSDGEIIIPCRGVQCEPDKPGGGSQNLELRKNPPMASMVDWRRLQ